MHRCQLDHALTKSSTFLLSRYYYAVATFSTVAAASYVYAECDTTEFERTANIMDLRFIPEEMEFEDEPR